MYLFFIQPEKTLIYIKIFFRRETRPSRQQNTATIKTIQTNTAVIHHITIPQYLPVHWQFHVLRLLQEEGAAYLKPFPLDQHF